MLEGSKAGKRRLGERAWRSLVEGFNRSGLSVVAYCERHGVSAASFYRWRSRVQGQSKGASSPKPIGIPGGFIDAGMLHSDKGKHTRLDLKLDLGEGWVLHLVRG